MKVLYIITKGNFGGAQRYVFDLATGLPNNIETVIAFGEGEILEQKLQKKGIKTIKLENAQRDVSIFKDVKLFFELFKLFKKEKPDVIHLNSSKIGFLGTLTAFFFNLLTAKSYKLKAIFTAHGWAFNDSKFFLSKFFLKIIQWKTVFLSHKTIAVSESLKKDFAGWPFIKNKIVAIYNGIETPNFLSKEEAREKLLLDQKEKVWIGTISELHKNKGLDILIESIKPILKNNPNLILVILGEGEEKENLLKLIKDRGMEKQIFLLGFIKDASQFLKAFDIFTLTSRTEGLPYVLLEASFADIPIIASRVGGIPEILEGENDILVDKENVRELKIGLEKIFKEQRKSTETDLKKFKEKFSVKRMIAETIKIYK